MLWLKIFLDFSDFLQFLQFLFPIGAKNKPPLLGAGVKSARFLCGKVALGELVVIVLARERCYMNG